MRKDLVDGCYLQLQSYMPSGLDRASLLAVCLLMLCKVVLGACLCIVLSQHQYLSAALSMQRLLSYEQAADVLFGGDDTGGRSSGGGSNTEGPTGLALSAAVARLLMRLLDNLESKSRSYKGEPALAALFMMNNVHYVQWSVEGSTAEVLLGRGWLERHKDLVEDWGARYHDITWGPLLALLKVTWGQLLGMVESHASWYMDDKHGIFQPCMQACMNNSIWLCWLSQLQACNSHIDIHRHAPVVYTCDRQLCFHVHNTATLVYIAEAALQQTTQAACNPMPCPTTLHMQNDAPTDVGRLKQYLKDTFSSFNAALERIYITQSSWTIPDAMLREAVKRVIKNDLLKPYQDFLRK